MMKIQKSKPTEQMTTKNLSRERAKDYLPFEQQTKRRKRRKKLQARFQKMQIQRQRWQDQNVVKKQRLEKSSDFLLPINMKTDTFVWINSTVKGFCNFELISFLFHMPDYITKVWLHGA